MRTAIIALWAVTVPLAALVLVDYLTRWQTGGAGLLPRHVSAISAAYLMLATVATWAARTGWERGVTLGGLMLGVVALVIVLRRSWAR